MGESMFVDFLKKLDTFCKDLKEFGNSIKNETELKPQVLTADKLQQLRWMNPKQLAAIYQYGKVPTSIADDPDAYKQMRWMTEAQLEAIFGKDGMNQ